MYLAQYNFLSKESKIPGVFILQIFKLPNAMGQLETVEMKLETENGKWKQLNLNVHVH